MCSLTLVFRQDGSSWNPCIRSYVHAGDETAHEHKARKERGCACAQQQARSSCTGAQCGVSPLSCRLISQLRDRSIWKPGSQHSGLIESYSGQIHRRLRNKSPCEEIPMAECWPAPCALSTRLPGLISTVRLISPSNANIYSLCQYLYATTYILCQYLD